MLGKGFVIEISPGQKLFDAQYDIFDIDEPHYDIQLFEADDDGFLAALRKLSEQKEQYNTLCASLELLSTCILSVAAVCSFEKSRIQRICFVNTIIWEAFCYCTV